MAQGRSADVIVPVALGGPAILGRLREILECSGTALGRLLVVEDGCGDLTLAPGLAELAASDPRVQVLRCPPGLGWVEYANRGLSERRGDAILLAPGARPTFGWIEPLAAAAHSEERVALASPLSDSDGFDALEGLDSDEARGAIAGLPESLYSPRAGIVCNYLRGDVLDAVGLLDATYSAPRVAMDDWLMRARSLGFFSKRSARSLVLVDGTLDLPGGADLETLHDRHRYMPGQVDRHAASLDATVAAHAIEHRATGRIKVALDLRHLPLEMNGTKMYAVSLGRALSLRPEIDLTLLAVHPLQADGITGRLVSPEEWADDVAIVHKPAQIFDRTHARLLFESKAHVVLTYQDLIAYRMAEVFPDEAAYNAYQQTSRLTIPAAQAILTYSENTAREVAAEFGADSAAIHPVFLGVDVDDFASPLELGRVESILGDFGLSAGYFLSLASDYPHKNLAGLLEAYAMFRGWWSDGEPPALALAGRASRIQAEFAEREGGPIPGVHFLGAVSHEQLRALYQNARALVFPSLYEGFGLPPLEAMAARAPVVAMPFSSVPEVCDDAVLYAEGLSPADLARAMQRIATDAALVEGLRMKGIARARSLSWEKTARETVEVYRKILTSPVERTLLARRTLSEAIVLWSQPPVPVAEPVPAAAAEEVDQEAPNEEESAILDPAVVEGCESFEGVEDGDEAGTSTELEPIVAETHDIEPIEVAAQPSVPALMAEPEPLGILKACDALQAAIRRRVRRELVRQATVQRARLGRAKRLSLRFVQVARTDGVRAASQKVARKAKNKARHVLRRLVRSRAVGGAACSYFTPPAAVEVYDAWRAANAESPHRADRLREALASIHQPPTFSILVPVYNTPAGLLDEAVRSVIAQVYPHWELILADDASTDPGLADYLAQGLPVDPRIRVVRREANGNISAATNTAAEHATGEFFVLLDHDDLLHPDALARLAVCVMRQPDVDMVYSDDDKTDLAGGRFAPQFKPDWSPELLLSFCYTGHLSAVRADLYRRVGGMRLGFEGSQDHDFWLRASERARRIEHIPQVLYHWRVLPGSTAASGHEKPHSFEAGRRAVEEAFHRRGVPCRVEQPSWAVAAGCGVFQPVMPDDGPSVALLIATKNQKKLLQTLLRSLERTTYRNYRVYIIDNESDDPETLDYLAGLPHTVLHIPNVDGRFNYAAIHNAAVARLDEDLVVFLNNDVEVIEPRWLSQMVGWSMLPGVGAVGARLLYGDRRIQHAGIVHGLHEGLAGHAFKLLPWWDGGAMGLARASRDCLAVTAACMLTPRKLFLRMDGFNEVDFGVAYNDADYGYRLHDAGLRSVLCAEAELFHHEGATRGFGDNPREEANYRRIHGHRRDPYFSPHLDPQSEAFTLKPTVVPVVTTDAPVRVLAVSHNLNWEGASRFELELTTGLKASGDVDPIVVSPVDGPLRDEYAKAGIDVRIDPSLVSLFGGEASYAEARRRTADLMTEQGCRVLHANTLQGFWAVDAAREAGVPSVWSIHESEAWQTYFDQFPPEIARIALGSMSAPYRVVFTARSSAEVWKDLDSQHNFGLVRYALNVRRFEREMEGVTRDAAREALGLGSGEICVLLLGTVCDRKGQHDLVNAFRLMSDAGASRVRCIVVGARDTLEYSRELRRMAAELAPGRRGRFHIVDETGATAAYWQAADVFCCTSRVESYPHVIQEAMGRGLPIVTTPVYGIPEQVRPGLNGLFFNPGDARTLAKHLDTLTRDDARRRAMGEASTWILRALPSHEDMIRQYARLIREAAESGVPGARVQASQVATPDLTGRRWFVDGQNAAAPNARATSAAVEHTC